MTKATKSWIGEIISEGVWAIIETFTVLKLIKDMNKNEQDFISSLTQEVDDLKEILNEKDGMLNLI